MSASAADTSSIILLLNDALDTALWASKVVPAPGTLENLSKAIAGVRPDVAGENVAIAAQLEELEKVFAGAGTLAVDALLGDREVDDSAVRARRRKARSLGDFLRIDSSPLAPKDAHLLLERLKALRPHAVSSAYFEPTYMGAQKTGGIRKFVKGAGAAFKAWLHKLYTSDKQPYLNPKPYGLGIRWAPKAWITHAGLGVGFCDLEGGWDLTHKSLPKFEQPQPPDAPPDERIHGTAVLGIIFGNGIEVRGIAPRATLKGLVSLRGTSRKKPLVVCILEAIELLEGGDVLLMAIQTHDGLPVEVTDDVFTAIQLAVSKGIVVVEAAGNLGHDLDAAAFDEKLAPAWATLGDADDEPRVEVRSAKGEMKYIPDSGAILVGGCLARLRDSWYPRHVGMNFGQAVDCFGFAEGVYTAAEAPNEHDAFKATSAASALIAGVALVLQGKARLPPRPAADKKFPEGQEPLELSAGLGKPLSPYQLRLLLRDNGGTPVRNADDAKSDVVGYIPEAPALLAKVPSFADLHLRQGPFDPDGVAWTSPDIVVTLSAETISISLTLRNIGRGDARDVKVRLLSRSRVPGAAATWSDHAELMMGNVEAGRHGWVTSTLNAAMFDRKGPVDILAVASAATDPGPVAPPLEFGDEHLTQFLIGYNNVAMTTLRWS